MISTRIQPIVLALLFALAGLGAGPRTVYAQNDSRSGPTPPRLRFIDGAVSFWRTGAEDWSAAQVNTALAAGDSLYAGDGANFEVQIGPRAFVRAASGTEIDLTSLDPGYTQFRITGGHAALDLTTLPPNQSIEVDSPNAAFTIDRPGYYRVDVDENRTAFSAARGGTATVIPGAGETTEVGNNQQIILDGTETVRVSVNAAPAPDEWDRWNYDRTAQLVEAPRSAQYVPAEIAGVDDLDRYGDWRAQARYGHVWVPRGVGADWAPYSTGRWVYDPFYEWTWVDNSPWGWAPYHYGRWVHFNGIWGWAPGPVVAVPVYSPALVAFFGAPGIGVSVSVGLPFVSWCALGFGEPIIPWWGRPGFVGRPYWGGWGGPRVVNNVVINNTRIVNVRNVTRFQNEHVRNAVIGMDRNQFGRGRTEHIRLDAQRVKRQQPLRGDLKVRPVAASFVPREARGQRPPDRLRTRRVVTTRPPQDPMSRLRAKGIEAKAPEVRPAPRVVQPQHGQGVPGARPRAGNGAGHPATAGEQPPPESGRSRHGGVQTGQPARPGPPARVERAQPAAPGASERAKPEQQSHPQAPPPHERAAPPPSSQHRAAPPERAAPQHGHPQAPPPHERAAQPPPSSRQQAAPPERAAPQSLASAGSTATRAGSTAAALAAAGRATRAGGAAALASAGSTATRAGSTAAAFAAAGCATRAGGPAARASAGSTATRAGGTAAAALAFAGSATGAGGPTAASKWAPGASRPESGARRSGRGAVASTTHVLLRAYYSQLTVPPRLVYKRVCLQKQTARRSGPVTQPARRCTNERGSYHATDQRDHTSSGRRSSTLCRRDSSPDRSHDQTHHSHHRHSCGLHMAAASIWNHRVIGVVSIQIGA